MYTIQTNEKGSRQMFITDEHLQTIADYSLLNDLVDSNGIVDDITLEKLKLNVRALMESQGKDDAEGLIALCRDVVFHENMKAFALNQLILLYNNWTSTNSEIEEILG